MKKCSLFNHPTQLYINLSLSSHCVNTRLSLTLKTFVSCLKIDSIQIDSIAGCLMIAGGIFCVLEDVQTGLLLLSLQCAGILEIVDIDYAA